MQISLDAFPIRLNKYFFEHLYQSKDIEGDRNFDYLDGTSMRRKLDTNMTLSSFLSLSWKNHHIRLQINSPTQRRIVYCAAISFPQEDHFTRFAWLDGPSTQANIWAIQTLYENIFNEKPEEKDLA